MIDFACKRFKLSEVIKCGLGLTKADYLILEYFLKHSHKWFTTDILAEDLKFNLSTVQRAVKKLNEKGIIERKQNNLDGGGYVYVYTVRNRKDIAARIMEIVDNWAKQVKHEFESWKVT